MPYKSLVVPPSRDKKKRTIRDRDERYTVPAVGRYILQDIISHVKETHAVYTHTLYTKHKEISQQSNRWQISYLNYPF